MLYREDLRECRKKKKELLLVNVVKKARRGTASSRDQVQSISKWQDLEELCLSPRSLRRFQLTLMAIWRGFASSALGTCISSMPSR